MDETVNGNKTSTTNNPDHNGNKAKRQPIRAFFGSELFNSRDLIGNLYLVEALEKVTNGKYKFYLAQHQCEQKVTHKIIKDKDTRGLMESQVAVFAFDGVELDSGTVVEFMQAKALDIPAVVYRTDFRGGSGEEAIDDKCNKWNLMVSFYPRTKIIYRNGVVDYRKYYKMKNMQNLSVHDIAQAYSEYMATIIAEAMEEVMESPPLLNTKEREKLNEQYVKLWGVDIKPNNTSLEP